jgi:hypothetical protein
MASFGDYVKSASSGLGARLPSVDAGDDLAQIVTDRLMQLAPALEKAVDEKINKRGGGDGCGCGGASGGAMLLNAGGQASPGGPGAFALTINIQGRPTRRNKLLMQSSVPGGYFSISQIQIGTNNVNFGGFAPSFAVDPANQSIWGMELDGEEFGNATTIVISGTTAIVGAHFIGAALFSLDRKAYRRASGSCDVD